MCVNCSGAFSQKMYSIVEIQGCQITLALSKTSVKLRLLMQQLLSRHILPRLVFKVLLIRLDLFIFPKD